MQDNKEWRYFLQKYLYAVTRWIFLFLHSFSLTSGNNSFLISGAMPPLSFRISRAHDATCVRINKRNRALSLWFDWIARDRNRRGELRREEVINRQVHRGETYLLVRPTRRTTTQFPETIQRDTCTLVAWSGHPIFVICISVSRKYFLKNKNTDYLRIPFTSDDSYYFFSTDSCMRTIERIFFVNCFVPRKMIPIQN